MKKTTQSALNLMLNDLAYGPIGPENVTTGRPFVEVLEELVTLGLASAHRSSIGEPTSEKATYTITEKGREELAKIQ